MSARKERLLFYLIFYFISFYIIYIIFFLFIQRSPQPLTLSQRGSHRCSTTPTTRAEPMREQPLRCFSIESHAHTASEAEPPEASAPANRRCSGVPSRLRWKAASFHTLRGKKRKRE